MSFSIATAIQQVIERKTINHICEETIDLLEKNEHRIIDYRTEIDDLIQKLNELKEKTGKDLLNMI